ncbi:MAG: hypothetical protein GTO40_31295 [Deltaproteobacteria bacterium]|nr:hypothetical protein [Deltaproteobacteria bacterium]
MEKVELTYTREWDGEAFQLVRKETVTPLKAELEHAFEAYEQWLAQMVTKPRESSEANEGEVTA